MITTSTTQRLILAATLALPLAAQQAPPALPAGSEAVAVEATKTTYMKYHFLAVGKQVYTCANGAWSNGVPTATLYDMNSNLKLKHSAGPTWATLDGKSQIKADSSKAVHFKSPDGASIDWLRLDPGPGAGSGDFANVGIIQRLYTGAGKPPASCTGSQVFESPYTAHYYFWTVYARQ